MDLPLDSCSLSSLLFSLLRFFRPLTQAVCIDWEIDLWLIPTSSIYSGLVLRIVGQGINQQVLHGGRYLRRGREPETKSQGVLSSGLSAGPSSGHTPRLSEPKQKHNVRRPLPVRVPLAQYSTKNDRQWQLTMAVAESVSSHHHRVVGHHRRRIVRWGHQTVGNELYPYEESHKGSLARCLAYITGKRPRKSF